MLPRSIGLTLCILVGLLSLLPVIAWTQIERRDREAREHILLGLRDRAALTQRFADNGPTETRSGVRGVQRAGLAEPVAANACKPTSAGASCTPATLALPAANAATPALLTPVDAALTAALGETGRWSSTELQVAASLYLSVVLGSLAILFVVLRRMSRFRDQVDEAVLGRLSANSIARHDTPRELAAVARLLDRLMRDLRYTIGQMRTAADENAHALRTPLATVSTALHAVRRHLPASEPRAQRAIKVIEMSVDRMASLINAAQRQGQSVAALVDAPRERLELAAIVEAAIAQSIEEATPRRVHVRKKLQKPITVVASGEALEVAIRDVLLSAVDNSPEDGEITVTLSSDETVASLVVDDCGCDGGDERLLFEQQIAAMPPEGAAASRWPGLSSVRRTSESLGGQTWACRNASGGLSVTLTLPVERTEGRALK